MHRLKYLGVPWDQTLGAPPPVGDLVRIAGHSAMAAVGVYTGLEGDGIWSGLGWIVGVGSAVCAIIEVGDLVASQKELNA